MSQKDKQDNTEFIMEQSAFIIEKSMQAEGLPQAEYAPTRTLQIKKMVLLIQLRLPLPPLATLTTDQLKCFANKKGLITGNHPTNKKGWIALIKKHFADKEKSTDSSTESDQGRNYQSSEASSEDEQKRSRSDSDQHTSTTKKTSK